MTPADDAELELEVMDALRGAQDLRDRLRARLSSGNPSISDLAYAIKLRVKEDYKLRDKVLKKRIKKPEYGVGDVRDIVGLRIITLYRLDTLAIIPLLIDLIQRDEGEFSLFRPNSVEEVIIFSTNPKGDAQRLPARVQSLFEARGLGGKAHIEEAVSNYTSIHIVAWGRGKYNDSYRHIPVEIQVRTAFEDAWGEIEHALKYKRARRGQNPDRLQSSFAHLNVLKTLIDGIAQYADQIKLQMQEPEVDRLRSAVSKSAEDPDVRLNRLPDLPEELKATISQAVESARPVLVGGPHVDAGDKFMQLRECLSQLDVAAQELAALPGLRPKTIKEADYVISMQRALLLFEIGNLLAAGESQLAQALQIYDEMERKFRGRLAVKYRKAKVLDAMGRRLEAIEKLREVHKRFLDPREPIPAHHWLRAAAPRVLGVLLWEEVDALRRQDAEAGTSATQEERLTLLKEAFDVTREAYDLQITEDTGGTASWVSERAKAANNLLYYALEVLAEGQAEPLVDGTPNEDLLRVYLTDLGADDPDKMDDARLLDTAMRALKHLGERSKATRAAARFLQLVESQLIAGGVNDVHTDEMIELARSILSPEPDA